MAGTINYLYDPNQDIYTISECDPQDGVTAIRPGRVIRVKSEVLVTEETLLYDIRLEGDVGTTEFKEADVFSTLTDAATEYETRLTP